MAETPTQYRMSGNPFFTRERPRARINTTKFFIPDPWGAGSVPQSKTPAQNPKQNQASGSDGLVQRNALILNNISNTMKIISEQMVGMNKALQVTSNLIVDGEKFKRKREEDEEKREEFLRNRKLAAKSETALEESALQKALMSPVRAMGNQVKSVLGSIQEALMIMFGGWLSWEFLRFIGAWADDNKKLMQNIKKRITSAVAISIGILGGLKWGLGKVISSIAGLGLAAGAFVGRNFLSKPLGMALSSATGGKWGRPLIYGAPFRKLPLFGRKPFIPPTKLTKPGLLLNNKGKIRGPFKRGGGTAISSIFDVFTGDYLSASLGASSLMMLRSGNPYAMKAGAVLGLVYWANQLLGFLPNGSGSEDGVSNNTFSGNGLSRGLNDMTPKVSQDGVIDFGIVEEAPKEEIKAKWHHGLPFFMNPTALMSVFGFDPFKDQRLPDEYTYWKKTETAAELDKKSGISTASTSADTSGLGPNWKKVDNDSVSKLGPVKEQPTIAIPVKEDEKVAAGVNAGSSGSTDPIPSIPTANRSNIYVQFAYSQSNLIGVA